MMNKTEDLIAYFFAESKLCFPGFGTLILERQDAKRNPVKNKIFGPKYSASFLYDEYDDSALKKFLEFYSNKNKVDIQIADNFIRKLSLDILNELGTTGFAQLEGFGVFRKVEDRFSFEFSPILNEVIEVSNPDYPLLVMSREEVKSQPSQQPQQPQILNIEPVKRGNSKSLWKKTGIAITGLSFLTFLCFLFCISDILKNKPDDLIIAEKSDTSKQITMADTASSEQDDLAVFVQDSVKQEEPEKTIEVVKPELKKSEAEKTVKGSAIKNDLKSIIDKAEQNKNYFDQTCIVIAGSFKNKVNAEKILKKVVRNGFKPYGENYNGNYRVGAVFDMKNISPDNHLEQMKAKVEKNSWILQPKQD